MPEKKRSSLMAYFEVYKQSTTLNIILKIIKKKATYLVQFKLNCFNKVFFTAVSLIHGSIYLQRYYKTRVVWPAGVFALLRFINIFFSVN